MEPNQINVTVENGIKILEIRKGDALPLREKQPLKIEGSINAPGVFWEKRKTDHKNNKCHVVYSYEQQSIKLLTEEEDFVKKEITGKLYFFSEFLNFGINKPGKEYTLTELQSFLKVRRFYFADKDQHAKLITGLSKFKATIQTKIEETKNNQGSQRSLLDVQVDSTIPFKFVLLMPIFKGFKNFKFEVEICYDIRDNSTVLWLESTALAELIQKETSDIIKKELELFKDLVCVEF